MKQIVVIGGGVIGLSTAVRIKERLPSAAVTIIAENFSPDTTADGAGGVWLPHALENTPVEKQRQWGQETKDHLVQLALSPDAKVTGTYFTSGYSMFKDPKPDPHYADLFLAFRHMTEKELALFPHSTNRYGWAYTSVMAQCKQYLPWLMNRFKKAGGKVIQKKIHSLAEVVDYDVVVNCTGLGARELVGDQSVIPIRGQVLVVKAPWIRMIVGSEGTNMAFIPQTDSVFLGLTKQWGNWDIEVDKDLRQKIWEGCCQLAPSLKCAEILHDWVGLRPSRPSVRLEVEFMQVNLKKLPVVHNYGHGGGGITLHWGCAREATDLVQQLLPQCKL